MIMSLISYEILHDVTKLKYNFAVNLLHHKTTLSMRINQCVHSLTDALTHHAPWGSMKDWITNFSEKNGFEAPLTP